MSTRDGPILNTAKQSGQPSPAPWRCVVDKFGTNILAADGSRVAYVHSCSCNAQADADADMLAAVPELLSAVEWFLPLVESFKPSHVDFAAEHAVRLRAAAGAVKKARGR